MIEVVEDDRFQASDTFRLQFQALVINIGPQDNTALRGLLQRYYGGGVPKNFI